jgi:hypothetical protein
MVIISKQTNKVKEYNFENTYLLDTYIRPTVYLKPMEQGPCWKADSPSAGIKISSPLSFITVLTRDRQWTLYWARWIHSTSSHPIHLRYILILSSDSGPRLGLPRCIWEDNITVDLKEVNWGYRLDPCGPLSGCKWSNRSAIGLQIFFHFSIPTYWYWCEDGAMTFILFLRLPHFKYN